MFLLRTKDTLVLKGQTLLHPVAIELTAGRRVLVYLTHGRCEITGRTAAFVTRHGFNVEPMKPGPEAPDRDEARSRQG